MSGQNPQPAANGGVIHDLGYRHHAGVRLGRERMVRLYGIAENLLDENYATVPGWTDPGLRFRAGIEAAF